MANAIEMVPQDDEGSVMTMNTEHLVLEAKKNKAVQIIDASIAALSAMGKEQVAMEIAGKTIHSASRCKAALSCNMKRLKKRFAKTTSARLGKQCFKDDVLQLLLNLEDVNTADLHGSVDVKFRRYVPGKCVPQIFD